MRPKSWSRLSRPSAESCTRSWRPFKQTLDDSTRNSRNERPRSKVTVQNQRRQRPDFWSGLGRRLGSGTLFVALLSSLGMSSEEIFALL
jgi:hypothetical protein